MNPHVRVRSPAHPPQIPKSRYSCTKVSRLNLCSLPFSPSTRAPSSSPILLPLSSVGDDDKQIPSPRVSKGGSRGLWSPPPSHLSSLTAFTGTLSLAPVGTLRVHPPPSAAHHRHHHNFSWSWSGQGETWHGGGGASRTVAPPLAFRGASPPLSLSSFPHTPSARPLLPPRQPPLHDSWTPVSLTTVRHP